MKVGKLEEENIQAKDNGVNSHSKPPEFYIISVSKFWILNILTMGAFSTVWLYLQWHRQNLAGRERVEPFWRTVFSLFFYHSLVERVKTQTEVTEVSNNWNGKLVATLNVCTLLLSRIASRIEDHFIVTGKDPGFFGVLSWGLIVILYFFKWNIQSKINLGYGDPTGASNSKVTGRNILWILVFWVVLISAVTIWVFFNGEI